MPKNFVRKTFDRWLAHSSARFHHPPRVVLQRKDYFVLQFASITPAIECVIKKEGMVGRYAVHQGEGSIGWALIGHVYKVEVGIYVIYQGETWDILTNFDVYQQRTSTGQYYCDACTPPEMFPSRATLWVAHCFEPLLAWANEHLQASQWLMLCRYGGITWAELKPREDMHVKEPAAHLVYACPVVRGKPSQTPSA